MTSFKRRALGISLVLFSGLALAGCGKKKGTSGTSLSETGTTVTVTEEEKEEIKTEYTLEEYIDAIYGEDTVLYSVDEENPYGIDLSVYGSGIDAIFYTPKEEETSYGNPSKDEFYSDYHMALTYEESQWRTGYGLISGVIEDEDWNPSVSENVKSTKGTYVLTTSGEYLSYIPDTDGFVHPVFYNGGYTDMDDVAAYLLAFGSLPPNSNYGTASGNMKTSIATWGIYGRCNRADFSGNVNKYPYEPLLPDIMGTDAIAYTETDYGTNGGYTYEFKSRTSQIQPYNNGTVISRGICRFVFVSDRNVKSIDERHVFYTCNHYNDFREYLNKEGKFGPVFGNETAGNPACSNASDWEDGYNSPTSYVAPELV